MSIPTLDNAQLKLRGATMRLTLSAGVANDLTRLKKSLKDLAERMGHPACATGCNSLHLDLEREFSARLDRDAVALNPQPLPPRSFLALSLGSLPERPVPVMVSGAVFDNIDSLSTSIEKVLGRLGCPQCCSGFDILFQRELDGFMINPKLDITGTGRFAR